MCDMQTLPSYLVGNWNQNIGSQPLSYSGFLNSSLNAYIEDMFCCNSMNPVPTAPTVMAHSKAQPQQNDCLILSDFYSLCTDSFVSKQPQPSNFQFDILAYSNLNPEAAEFCPKWAQDSNLVTSPEILQEGIQNMFLESIQASNAKQHSFVRDTSSYPQKSQQASGSDSVAKVSALCTVPVEDCSQSKENNDRMSHVTEARQIAEHFLEPVLKGVTSELAPSGSKAGDPLLQESIETNKSEAAVQELTSQKELQKTPDNLLKESLKTDELEAIMKVTPGDKASCSYSGSSTEVNPVPLVNLSLDNSKTSLPKNGFVAFGTPLYTKIPNGTTSLPLESDYLVDEARMMPLSDVIPKVNGICVNKENESAAVCSVAVITLEDEANDAALAKVEKPDDSTNNLEETEDWQSDDEDDSFDCLVLESSFDDVILPFMDLVGDRRRRNLSECSSLSSDSIVFCTDEDDGCYPVTSSDSPKDCHSQDSCKTDSLPLQWIQVDFSDDDDDDDGDIIFSHSPVVGFSGVFLQDSSSTESTLSGTKVNLECGLLLSFDDDSEDEDEVDGEHLAAILEVNKRWQSHCDDLPEKPKTTTKVKFREAVMIKEVPAEEDRKGPWALYALDTERFRRRIESSEKVLSPMLCPAHRDKVFSERFQSSA